MAEVADLGILGRESEVADLGVRESALEVADLGAERWGIGEWETEHLPKFYQRFNKVQSDRQLDVIHMIHLFPQIAPLAQILEGILAQG